MDENQLRDELKKYIFYHIIQVTENLSTPGYEDYVPIQEVPLRALSSLDLKNKRVLDIGCRDGLFSFEAEKLGAQEIIGIDNDLSMGAVNVLIPHFKSKVKMYEFNVIDLKPETFGMFDVVIFPGVLYHLRYPFWVLKQIKDVLHEGGQLIIETAVLVDDNKQPLLLCPIGSEGPYHEATSCTFFNIKGLTDTLTTLDLVTQKTELLSPPPSSDNKNLLSSIKSRLRALKPVKPYVDRATFICCKQSQTVNQKAKEYWDSTHKLETLPVE
jgi:SAM-dependent methyltransferase